MLKHHFITIAVYCILLNLICSNFQWFSYDGSKRPVDCQNWHSCHIDECHTECTAFLALLLWCSCNSHTRCCTVSFNLDGIWNMHANEGLFTFFGRCRQNLNPPSGPNCGPLSGPPSGPLNFYGENKQKNIN